jgi:hypothetical protein
MSKHTPGPWKIVGANGARKFNKFSIRPVTSKIEGVLLPLAYVCRFDGEEFGMGCGEANATLIAAAPDLLEALQKLLSYGTFDDYPNTNEWYAVRDARAAIAKAIGGAA